MGSGLWGPCSPIGWHGPVPLLHLHVAPVQVHPSDHATLGGHIGPVDHLLSVVEVQGHGIVQALGSEWGQGSQLLQGSGRGRRERQEETTMGQVGRTGEAVLGPGSQQM